MMDKQIKEFI